MKKYYFFIGLALITLLSSKAMALTLTASVDRSTIALNESLRLIVEADESVSGSIDFTELTHQFDIVNTRRSKQTTIVNGKVNATTQWLLILSPKETGKLVIPSVSYQGSFSQALTITVNEAKSANNSAQKQDADAFLEAKIDRSSVYVQQQVLLTFRLYYRAALSSYDDEALAFGNTAVTAISENNFQTTFQGKSYNVLEKVYALHPQSSGTLSIPAQTWRLERSLRSLQFNRSANPYLFVRSEPLTVDVKPIAAQSTAEHWLPSTAVTLEQQWQRQQSNRTVLATVGEPIKFRLKLSANGLTPAQLPILSLPDSDDFTLYSEQPETAETKSALGIVGNRTVNFAVIPRKSGEFRFPEVTLRWWNVSSDREETITLPEQQLIVANPAATGTQLPTLTSLPAPVESQKPASSWIWQITTGVLALLCLALTYLLYQKRTLAPASSNKPESANSTIANKPEALLKSMHASAAANDWQNLRRLLLQWGQIYYDDIQSLDQLRRYIPELGAEVIQLDQQLYGQSTNQPYSPERLLEKIKKFKIGATEKNNSKLAQLYS